MMDINLKVLCEWLKDRTDEFTVLDALEACGTPPYATTHDLRVRMGFVLKQIGCTKRARCGEPHEARFFYQPPAPRTIEQVLMLFPSVEQVLMLSPSIERGPDDDAVDRHLDAVLRASGSALRHYTMQKSLDDMRAAMRAAMTPAPLFDSQCRELCAALGWQGGTYHLVLAEVKRLKAVDPAPHVGIIRELLNIAGLAWRALDDSEEVETPDGRGHAISDIDFDALTQALDELDELPDDQPGVTMSPAMKAAWALRSILVDQEKGGSV